MKKRATKNAGTTVTSSRPENKSYENKGENKCFQTNLSCNVNYKMIKIYFKNLIYLNKLKFDWKEKRRGELSHVGIKDPFLFIKRIHLVK